MKQRSPWFRRIAFAIVAGGLAFVAGSYYFAVKLTDPMRRPVAGFGDSLPASTEAVRFAATDGVELAGWFVPHAGTNRAVVLLHGHWGSRRQMLARAKLLHAQGYSVLLYDARGHGESDGKRISIGWFETRDLLGAIRFLRGRGFQELGLVGMSQGAATISLAARQLPDVRWAVLESGYPTLLDAVDRRVRRWSGLPGWLGAVLMLPLAEARLGISVAKVAPLGHIGHLRCPVLIIHGERDRLTRPESARELFARVAGPKSLWLVPGAGHVDLYGFAKADYERRVLDFIASATAPTAAPALQIN